MPDQQRFRNEDLVLGISKNINPAHFDINQYEPFIDALCGMRQYQKDAIRETLRYFLSGRYTNIRALAEENFYSNNSLVERFGTFAEMERHLQLPNQLSCSIDLATGTGKSFVMYGIARIMLAHGAVDRVLVLCPSRTIEKGLISKFRQLSGEAVFKELLPQNSRISNPHIINGTESIVDGTICIENFHATLAHVNSSIRDSLAGKGNRTLVLNDEVHHVYNPRGEDLKRWKEFLLLPEFSFRFIVGFSGTCYIGSDYFTDVIARYSLRQAIEDGYTKTIDYVAEDSSDSQDEKLQKIYDNHIQNKNYTYRRVKPLTIFISRDISACKRLTEEIVEFLGQQEHCSTEDAQKKVLIITSAREHQINIRRLEEVDRADSPVEWIISVSMLTEGWDVKNVFQIVPHEERAFNSKLLISQVLGRGLRIPDAYLGQRPVVTVFNHDAWSNRIKHLVDEVMEIEKRIHSFPISKPQDYSFFLHHIDYNKTQEIEEFTQASEYEFTKGYVTLVSQLSALERETTYARITGERRTKNTLVRYRMFTTDEVADHIHAKLKAIDMEEGTNYSEKYSLQWLKNLISESLRKAGEKNNQVSEENRQRLQKAFGVIHRKTTQVVRYRMLPNALRQINTADRRRNGVGVGTLRRGEATIFLDDHALSYSDEDTKLLLAQILGDESLPHSAWQHINNSYHFKTPLNIVIADHKPERDFIRHLIKQENIASIDAWIKSTDQEFYQIEYAWRKGEHQKRGFFNPDFFIKKGNIILVVEIKGDEELQDPSDENKAKNKAAFQHFEVLNTLVTDYIYKFHFLTPSDYDSFFQFLRDSNYNFISKLDAALTDMGN